MASHGETQALGQPTAADDVDVAAAPVDVWAVVADVTRTPEWSPVCHRCEWIDGSSSPVVGARFRGHNRLNGARWSRDCVVTEAEPGVVFAFSTLFRGEESTRWRYRIEPRGTGSRLEEAYEIVRIPPWIRVLRLVPGMKSKSERDTRSNLATSLARIKEIVERGR